MAASSGTDLITNLTVDAITKDALEKMMIKQQYADYFNAKIYGKKEMPIYFEAKNEVNGLLATIEKLQMELVSMTADRDYWHKICDAIIEAWLISNPNHPDNQPQPQFHVVISAINKIGKNPHASRYSVIENGEIN